MCRMFGFLATHPTHLGCALVDAPHSLLVQSSEDLEGFAHADGWGIAQWQDRSLSVTRHVEAAHEGEEYRAVAREVRARCLIAHVRQATAGDVCLQNTHPFVEAPWVFVHNGTVRHFADGVGDRMRAEIARPRHDRIKGTTDSEVLFQLLMTRLQERPQARPLDVLAAVISDVASWCSSAGPCENLGLNVLLSDGSRLFGARWQQSLWTVRREGIYDRELCGTAHREAAAPPDYRALLIASEPLTDEPWHPMPEQAVFEARNTPGGPSLDMQRCGSEHD